jgi:hypothetical protein
MCSLFPWQHGISYLFSLENYLENNFQSKIHFTQNGAPHHLRRKYEILKKKKKKSRNLVNVLKVKKKFGKTKVQSSQNPNYHILFRRRFAPKPQYFEFWHLNL